MTVSTRRCSHSSSRCSQSSQDARNSRVSFVRFAGVKAGATGWDSESMQHYGDRIKCKIAPVHTKDRNPIMADWIS